MVLLTQIKVGDTVRIHPASDWFMRGATHAVCTSTRKGEAYRFKLCNIGPERLRVFLPEYYILDKVKG